ncbi:MAG TPA: hypothetical protein VHY91_04865 [Pirellulales bacterium]|jgi:hypothetical protein|nr:hypothetical protein [Pirellulales bacterium]
MNRSRHFAACLSLALLTITSGRLTASEPIAISNHRELFLDSLLVDHLRDATIELCEPRPCENVLQLNEPWEGVFSAYTTIIRDGDTLRMYYRGGPQGIREDGTNAEVTCYAESTDGIHWTKPKLGLFEIAGSKDNNVVLAGMAPSSHNLTPLLDTRPGVPADERYKALANSKSTGDFVTLSAFASPDGIHWRKLRDEPVMTAKNVGGDWSFDSQNVAFWSESEQKYVCYYRKVTNSLRSVNRVTSDDFVHWSAPEPMRFSNTGTTTPANQLYTNQTQPYFRAPQIYVATAARFMPGRKVVTEAEAKNIGVHPEYYNDTSDAVLMSTRGGTQYDCMFSRGFLKPGIGMQNWVSRTNYPALNVVQTGPTEMSLYVQGDYGQKSAHLRRYSLRLDGFSSLRAPLSGGELVTKPLTFTGSRLHLNFATSAAGDVRVEIQDADGKAIPGYSLDDARELIGNETERVYAWKTSDDVSALAGRPVRLRFVLRDADLFSFQFQ